MSTWTNRYSFIIHGGRWGFIFNRLPGNCTLLPTASEIFDLIGADRPVILLGNMPDVRGSGKIQHAITLHGAQREYHSILNSDWYYWAHYGWGTSYNNVRIHDSISNMLKGAAVYY